MTLFLALSFAFELLFLIKMAYLIVKTNGTHGRIGQLRWFRRCGSWLLRMVKTLGSSLWPRRTAIDDAVKSIRVTWCHKMLHCFGLLMTSAVLSIQYNMVLGRDRWMSSIATWSYLLTYSCFTIYIICPSLLDKSSMNAFYIAGMAFTGLAVSPWHVDAENLMGMSLLLFIFVRLPLVVLCSQPLLVLLCNMCFVAWTNYRAYTEAGFELEGKFGSAYQFSWIEFGTCVSTVLCSIAFQQILTHKVELKIQSDNAETQFGAASSLLGLMCDVVVELDHNFCLTEHSNSLAAMLLKSNNISGASLLSFMPAEDAERALRHLHDFGTSTHKRHTPAHAFHTRLVDSCSTKLCTEARLSIFQCGQFSEWFF